MNITVLGTLSPKHYRSLLTEMAPLCHTGVVEAAHNASAMLPCPGHNASLHAALWWHAPFFSAGGYASEAAAFMLALARHPQNTLHLGITQHGDAFDGSVLEASMGCSCHFMMHGVELNCQRSGRHCCRACSQRMLRCCSRCTTRLPASARACSPSLSAIASQVSGHLGRHVFLAC